MDDALRGRLEAVSTTSLCDAGPGLRVLKGLQPVQAAPRLVGVARTVACRGDLLPVLQGLGSARSGEVLVVDATGSDRAVAGELFTMQAAQAGLTGLVVDGYVRDVQTLRTLAVAVYARGVVPAACPAADPGQVQVPVQCGGAEEIERTEASIRRGLVAGLDLAAMSNYRELVAGDASRLRLRPPP